MNGRCFDGHEELYHIAKFGEDRTVRAGCRCESVVFVFLLAGCHGNVPVLNLLSASVVKNQHFRPYRKNCALDRKMINTF